MDWKSFILIFCCVFIAQSLYAEDPTPKNKNEIKLKTIEVVGKRKNTNPNQHHVKVRDLDTVKGIAGIGNEVPGVDVRESGGPGQRTVVSLRGLPAQGTEVKLEGVPINFPYFGGADVSQIALPEIGSMDIITGGMANGGHYGSMDVHLHSMKPGHFMTRMTGGSLGFGMLDAQGAFQAGPVKIQPMASFRYCKGDFAFTDTNDNERQRTHNSSMAGEGAVKTVVRAHGNKWTTVVDGFADRRDVAGMEQFPSKTALQHDQRFFIVEHIHGNTAGRFRHNSSFYIRYSGFSYKDPSPPMGPKVNTDLKTLTIAGSTTHSIRIKGFKPFVGVGMKVVRGWTDRPQQQIDNRPQRATVFGLTGLKYRQRYVEVSAGIRGDWTQEAGFHAIPAATIVIKPIKYLYFEGTASRFFRVPSFDELYFNAYFVRGNPLLQSEIGWRFSAGLVVKTTHFRFRSDWFHVIADRLIMFLPTSAYTIQAQNTAGATSGGVEASVRLKFSHFRAITGYTWTRARFKASGKALPYVPQHKVFAVLRGKIRHFSTYIGVKWQSGFFMDAFEDLHEEARWNLYAGVRIRIKKMIQVSIFGNNLLDKRDAVDAFQQPLPGRQVFLSLSITGGAK